MKYLYSLLIVFIIFTLSMLLVFKENLDLNFEHQTDQITASVYLKKGLTNDKVDFAINQIKSICGEALASAKLISPEEQLNELAQSLPGYENQSVDFEELKGSVSFLVELKLKDTALLENLTQKIKALDFIEQVDLPLSWIKKINGFYALVKKSIYFLILFFLILSTFMLVLISKIYLLSEKETLEVYCFHGADPHQTLLYHFRPLIVFSLSAFIFSILLVYALYKNVLQQLNASALSQFLSQSLRFLSSESILFLGGGLLISLVTAYTLSYFYLVKTYYNYE